MIVKQIKNDWYMGRSKGLVFFGRTRYEVMRKGWAHSYQVDYYRLADKLIELDREYWACASSGAVHYLRTENNSEQQGSEA